MWLNGSCELINYQLKIHWFITHSRHTFSWTLNHRISSHIFEFPPLDWSNGSSIFTPKLFAFFAFFSIVIMYKTWSKIWLMSMTYPIYWSLNIVLTCKKHKQLSYMILQTLVDVFFSRFMKKLTVVRKNSLKLNIVDGLKPIYGFSTEFNVLKNHWKTHHFFQQKINYSN